jgi:hypothetical protein
MKKFLAAGASLLILAGCSTPTPEEQFVSDFRESMVTEQELSDTRIVAAGLTLCDIMELSPSDDTIDLLMETGAKSEEAAIDLVASAQRHLCQG